MARTALTIEDPDYDQAVKRACAELGVPASDVDVKILIQGKKGLFGMLSRPWKIKVMVRNFGPEAEAAAGGADATDEEKATARAAKEVEAAIKAVKAVDATFSMRSASEGIFMICDGPSGGGRQLNVADVVDRLKDLGLRNIDADVVKVAIDPINYGMPIKIAGPDPAFKVDRDSEIVVDIDRERMSAAVMITEPFGKGRIPAREKVLEALTQAGVRLAPDPKALDELLKNIKFGKYTELVKGRPAVHGRNAFIRWGFDTETTKVEITINEDGSVDFHKILKISTVHAGDLLGEKIPATAGVDGQNVFGLMLVSKAGRDVKLAGGKNVKVDHEAGKMTSEIDGQVLLQNNVVTVLPIFEVKGDVDLSTGDIDFIGSVLVMGSVGDGFEVKAGGNIEVRGIVNSSKLQAAGSILVRGGILGKDAGKVSAGTSVATKFVENAHVQAGEDVTVERAIMNSEVTAGRKITVLRGKKGMIVGGNLTAGDEIDALIIGSPLGTKTVLTVGINPLKIEELARLDEELKAVLENLDKITKTLALFSRILDNQGKLSPEQEPLYTKSAGIKGQLATRRDEIESQKADIEKGLDVSRHGRVIARNCFYPGVTVTVRKGTYVVNDTLKSSALGYEEGFVRVLPI